MSHTSKKRAWQVPALVLALAAPHQEGQWTQKELESESAAIQRDVASLRGAEFKRPVAMKVASKKELVDYLIAQSAKQNPPERIVADETIAKMLGVIPADMDILATELELLEGQVAGFYDPESEGFFLMEGYGGGLAPVILAHELVHALDDQLYDLDGGLKQRMDNTDAAQAYRAVAEGSGTVVMTRWMMANPNRLDLSGYSKLQAEMMASLGEAPVWLQKPLLAAYLCGAAFLARSNKLMSTQATNADIEAAFRSPPASTEQILHPEKYWESELRDEPREARQEFGELPKGWEVMRRDRLGELLLAVVAMTPADRIADQTKLFAPFTNAAATGWGGDEVLLLGKASGKARYLSLRTLWDTPRDAAEFYGTMSVLLRGLEARGDELGRRGSAKLEYGAEDEVLLEVHHSLTTSELKDLRTALGRSSD